MIRPFTIVCMLMAVGSGLYLYQCKHQAQVLDRKIASTLKQTEVARDRISMLRAEWAQLNEPQRVAELARAHSDLQTAKPTQFIAVSELSSKLPAPVAPSHQLQPTDLPDDTEATTPLAQAEPAPAASRVTAAEAKPETKPETRPATHAPVVAEAKPVQSANPAPIAEARPSHHVAPASAAPASPAVQPAPQVAAARPPAVWHRPEHRVATASVAVSNDAVAPGTVGAAVLRAMRSRDVNRAPREPAYVEPAAVPADTAPRYTTPVYSSPTYAPQAYAAPISGSMLGGRSSALPPPVPFAAR